MCLGLIRSGRRPSTNVGRCTAGRSHSLSTRLILLYTCLFLAPVVLQVRTENPGEANLFFIPLLERLYNSNKHHHVLHVTEYVKKNYPHQWARNEGAEAGRCCQKCGSLIFLTSPLHSYGWGCDHCLRMTILGCLCAMCQGLVHRQTNPAILLPSPLVYQAAIISCGWWATSVHACLRMAMPWFRCARVFWWSSHVCMPPSLWPGGVSKPSCHILVCMCPYLIRIPPLSPPRLP